MLGAALQCACYMRRGVVTRIARLVGLTRGILYSTLLYSTWGTAQQSTAQHSTAQHSATKAVCAWCWAVNCGFVGCPLHRLIVSTCGLGGVGCRTVWRADGRNGKGLDCWPKGKRQYLEKKKVNVVFFWSWRILALGDSMVGLLDSGLFRRGHYNNPCTSWGGSAECV